MQGSLERLQAKGVREVDCRGAVFTSTKSTNQVIEQPHFDILVLRVGSLGAGSVGFEGQNQFPQSCRSIFRHRVSSCCSISLFMYFNSNFSTGGTAHGSLEKHLLGPWSWPKTTSTLASLREETIISPWLSSVLVQLHFLKFPSVNSLNALGPLSRATAWLAWLVCLA